MIRKPNVEAILYGVAMKEFPQKQWRVVTNAVNDIVGKFAETNRPVLASIQLDNAVTKLRRALEGTPDVFGEIS